MPATMPAKAKIMCRKVMKAKKAKAKANAVRNSMYFKSPTRASHAAHTRSQGEFPDPPVRLQNPRLRIEEPRFGFHEGRFHCGAIEEPLRRGDPRTLVAASLKESTIPGAGLGLFVRDNVQTGKIFCEYGGQVITLDEARKRQRKVVALAIFRFRTHHHHP